MFALHTLILAIQLAQSVMSGNIVLLKIRLHATHVQQVNHLSLGHLSALTALLANMLRKDRHALLAQQVHSAFLKQLLPVTSAPMDIRQTMVEPPHVSSAVLDTLLHQEHLHVHRVHKINIIQLLDRQLAAHVRLDFQRIILG